MGHSWSAGYVADLPYTHGYYHELAPGFIRFGLLLAGLDHGGGDPTDQGHYRYCELGYGQGVSANLHAAANPRGRFWGTDFHPEHALFAQGLAQRTGLSAKWLACSFEQLLDEDLPEFDLITLHGVWSWIDEPTREALLRFFQRRLKVGGVVYLSSNVMPGWSAERPLRDLMRLHTEAASAPGAGTATRIEAAVGFAGRLRQAGAAYFAHNPPAVQMLGDLQREDIHVVAHEYFNRAWQVGYFADLARSLEGAGLQFACSLHKSDLLGEVRQRARGCALEALDLSLRETAHDFILNRRFRRDVFVRGARRLSEAEREARLLELEFVLTRPAGNFGPTVGTPYGTVSLDGALLRPLLQALETAAGPLSLQRLCADGGLQERPLASVLEPMVALVAQGLVFPVFGDDLAHAGASRARAINRVVAECTPHEDLIRYLASPVTGHAVEASWADRLMLIAWEQGARAAPELAEVARTAAPQAWESQPASAASAEGPPSPLGEAERFLVRVAPAWRRLGILEGVDP